MKKYISNGKNHGEFIVPVFDETGCKWRGIKTRNEYTEALVVYVGVEISKEDVFAKIVDAGFNILSVGSQLNVIEKTINTLSGLKIGSKVTLINEDLINNAS
jgi:hypothetical protein